MGAVVFFADVFVLDRKVHDFATRGAFVQMDGECSIEHVGKRVVNVAHNLGFVGVDCQVRHIARAFACRFFAPFQLIP
ncbi:MAG: hypothetical protein FMNOHCHN_03660 [Ignavibacteriaceae bacterium]|nr:hypothetical protein [Ignavibacteriaceae bacterium]